MTLSRAQSIGANFKIVSVTINRLESDHHPERPGLQCLNTAGAIAYTTEHMRLKIEQHRLNNKLVLEVFKGFDNQ